MDEQSQGASHSVFVWDRYGNSWMAATPLLAARAGHRLVVLSDGRILAVGGQDGAHPVALTEYWRPGEPAWQAAGSLSFARKHAVAVALADGSVLTLGGEPTRPGGDCPAELWNPSARRWSVVSEIAPRCGAQAAATPDGRVLVAGGWEGDHAVRTVGLWEPSIRRFTEKTAMREQRASFGLHVSRDGSAMAIGGFGVRWLSAPGLEIYSSGWPAWGGMPIATGLWLVDEIAEMSGGDLLVPDRSNKIWRLSPRTGAIESFGPPLGGGRPVALPGDGVLVLSQGRAQVFRATGGDDGRWLVVARPRSLASGASLLALRGGGAVLVAGDAGLHSDLDATEVFDGSARGWSLGKPPAQHRNLQVAAALLDGRVLIAGGIDRARVEPPQSRWVNPYRPPWISRGMLSSAELWSPALGWLPIGALHEARASAPSVTLTDGRVLVLGGYQQTYGPSYLHAHWLMPGPPHVLSSVEAWSARSSGFMLLAPMLEPRMQHTATALTDDRVLVVGGATMEGPNGRPRVSAEIWDPKQNRWTAVAAPNVPRRNHSAVRLRDGRVLVAGGQLPVQLGIGEAQSVLDSVEIWDPRTNVWQLAAPMSRPRRNCSLVLLADGRVMVAGGMAGAQSTPEIWDPKTNQWTFTGALAATTDGLEAIVGLSDGRVLLVNGIGAQIWTPTAQP